MKTATEIILQIGCFKDGTKLDNKSLLSVQEALKCMEAYHNQFKVSDEEIEKEYPSTIAQLGRLQTQEEQEEGIFFTNYFSQQGAKWMRDKIFPK